MLGPSYNAKDRTIYPFFLHAIIMPVSLTPLYSFLCLRKEKKPVSPVGGSSLKSIVDPSQEPNSDELLALCSGRFEETQNPTAGERERERDHSRNLSDSTSSQAVRELLGLPVRSPRQSSGIDRLLVSGSVPSEDTTQGSCMSEVLGLCSGVFPTTQPAAASTVSVIVCRSCVLPCKAQTLFHN